MLKFTLLVLLASTWTFMSSVFATRPVVAEKPVETALTAIVRLPASLPTALQPTTKTATPMKMDSVVLKCWDQPDESPRLANARLVRLQGRVCGSTAGKEVLVKNLSNGYAATVFETGERDLTTEYIPLEEGVNELEITLKEREVSNSFKFTITREL